MSTFVRIVCSTSTSGIFNDEQDTRKVNNILAKLQQKGAHILNIQSTVSQAGLTGHSATPAAIHIVAITYDGLPPQRIPLPMLELKIV